MHDLFDAFQRGVRWSFQPLPLLALYLAGLLIGLVQSWPALLLWTGNVRQPWIGQLAGGDGDAFAALLIGGGPNAALGSLLWIGLALLLALVYAIAYNLTAGGALSRWYGLRAFGAGCRHTFWSFSGLGALLLLLLLPALALAVLGGVGLGAGFGVAIAILLIQLLNLAGEYARALMVHTQRRNPAWALGRAFAFCARQPASLLFALIGVALHTLLGWLAMRSADLPTIVALGLGQLWALAWIWLKLLRLAWAAALVGRMPLAAPASATTLADMPEGS